MKTSEKGLAIIKEFEGLRLEAYLDVVGKPTIGYGSTYLANGEKVALGMKLANEAEADALLRNTVGQYETAVNHNVKVILNQNQFDALVSFTYNEGTEALAESTLLNVLNTGDYIAASAHFASWNKITKNGIKIVSDTLTKRRKEESELFLTA